MARASSKSLAAFPLLLIPLAIYNIVVFLMPGVGFATPLTTLALPSSGAWPLTMGDVLVALGIVLLFLEMMKSSRPGARFITDHILAFIVFGGALAEFLLLKPFATSAFFMLTLIAAMEFLAGTALALRFRRAAADVAPDLPDVIDERPIKPALPSSPVEKIEPRLDPKPAVDVMPPSVATQPSPTNETAAASSDAPSVAPPPPSKIG